MSAWQSTHWLSCGSWYLSSWNGHYMWTSEGLATLCNVLRWTKSVQLPCSVSLSPSSSSSPSLLTFPPSSLLTFHNASPSVPSTALDIQQFLKPFAGSHCWWDAQPCCYDPLLVRCTAMLLWSTLTEYYIYTYNNWFINLTESVTIHSFLHRWC